MNSDLEFIFFFLPQASSVQPNLSHLYNQVAQMNNLL